MKQTEMKNVRTVEVKKRKLTASEAASLIMFNDRSAFLADDPHIRSGESCAIFTRNYGMMPLAFMIFKDRLYVAEDGKCGLFTGDRLAAILESHYGFDPSLDTYGYGRNGFFSEELEEEAVLPSLKPKGRVLRLLNRARFFRDHSIPLSRAFGSVKLFDADRAPELMAGIGMKLSFRIRDFHTPSECSFTKPDIGLCASASLMMGHILMAEGYAPGLKDTAFSSFRGSASDRKALYDAEFSLAPDYSDVLALCPEDGFFAELKEYRSQRKKGNVNISKPRPFLEWKWRDECCLPHEDDLGTTPPFAMDGEFMPDFPDKRAAIIPVSLIDMSLWTEVRRINKGWGNSYGFRDERGDERLLGNMAYAPVRTPGAGWAEEVMGCNAFASLLETGTANEFVKVEGDTFSSGYDSFYVSVKKNDDGSALVECRKGPDPNEPVYERTLHVPLPGGGYGRKDVRVAVHDTDRKLSFMFLSELMGRLGREATYYESMDFVALFRGYGLERAYADDIVRMKAEPYRETVRAVTETAKRPDWRNVSYKGENSL